MPSPWHDVLKEHSIIFVIFPQGRTRMWSQYQRHTRETQTTGHPITQMVCGLHSQCQRRLKQMPRNHYRSIKAKWTWNTRHNLDTHKWYCWASGRILTRTEISEMLWSFSGSLTSGPRTPRPAVVPSEMTWCWSPERADWIRAVTFS